VKEYGQTTDFFLCKSEALHLRELLFVHLTKFFSPFSFHFNSRHSLEANKSFMGGKIDSLEMQKEFQRKLECDREGEGGE